MELQLHHQSFQRIFMLISFRMDWFDLLAVQGTLKHLLQHHSLKASNLQCSSFFMVQLSHLCMTTRKTIALSIQIFVSKVMSLLFNMLSGFVIVFLPRSKCLLISWLQPPSAMIFMKRTSFLVLFLEGVVGLQRTSQLQLPSLASVIIATI